MIEQEALLQLLMTMWNRGTKSKRRGLYLYTQTLVSRAGY